MEKRATTLFNSKNRDFQLRYMQKYYLPQEIRDIIYPADIEGISRCFDDECERWKDGRILCYETRHRKSK